MLCSTIAKVFCANGGSGYRSGELWYQIGGMLAAVGICLLGIWMVIQKPKPGERTSPGADKAGKVIGAILIPAAVVLAGYVLGAF